MAFQGWCAQQSYALVWKEKRCLALSQPALRRPALLPEPMELRNMGSRWGGPGWSLQGVVFFLNCYYSKWPGFLLWIRRGAKLARPAGLFHGKPQACAPLWLADLRPGVLWGLLPTCFSWAVRESSCLLPSAHPDRGPAWAGELDRPSANPFCASLCLELII